ncbi:MAG TPA: glycosyltransferase family 4 protein [Mycobacteriales bacterium]|nr:glycosyltransferase family 4 protein [Mycobacteriales bacterium]
MPEHIAEPMPSGRSVLLVVADVTGGIRRHVRDLADGLPARGLRVVVCAPSATIARLDLGGLDVTVVEAPVGSSRPGPLAATRRALRSAAREADLVHAHGLRAGAQAVGFGGDTPLVVTWHNAGQGGALRRAMHRALARYVARSTDLTLVASSDLGDAARAAGATLVRSAFVTAPALSPATKDPLQLRSELGVGTRPVVLGIGRLHRQKRWDVLVDAAASWSGERSPVVVIAGEGPGRADLERRIAASGAPVRLLGYRTDVADLLAVADVVALPSEWEARALVAQEALRAGVPLVTTDVGGLGGLVRGAAVIVPVGDAGALRNAVESIIADDERRQNLIAAGIAKARRWPDREGALDQLVANYADLLDRISLR